MTYNGSILKAYLDGKLIGKIDFKGNIANSDFPINIGRNPVYNGDYFNGGMDELAIYNDTLSDKEIGELYNKYKH